MNFAVAALSICLLAAVIVAWYLGCALAYQARLNESLWGQKLEAERMSAVADRALILIAKDYPSADSARIAKQALQNIRDLRQTRQDSTPEKHNTNCPVRSSE